MSKFLKSFALSVLITGFAMAYANVSYSQVSADFSEGAVIIGPSVDDCDGTTLGAIRYSSTSNYHQFCDGLVWRSFLTASPVVNLTITPGSNAAMNVTGPGGPAYGSTATFQVKNVGAGTSASLTVVLNEPTDNFDIVSDGCTGLTLAQDAFCNIDIRPKATVNGDYQATLSIPQNNSPLALLKGTASGFGCVVGADGPGGKYVSCGAYNVVTTPGGCTDSNYPVCAGGTDTLTKTFGVADTSSIDRYMVESQSDGPQNTVNLMAYVAVEGSGRHPGAEYCMNMVYNGYDDWYLPGFSELQTMYSVRASLGGWASATYLSSTESSATAVSGLNSAGGSDTNAKTNAWRIRCLRREGASLPTVQPDLSPLTTYFAPVMTTTGNRVSSASKTLDGVNAPVNISLANDTSGGARVKINNGAEVTSGTAVYGNSIQVVMTAPGSIGADNTVDVVIGDLTTQFKVAVPDETGTRRIFASSPVGATSGVGFYDARCQSDASGAGLAGTWKALVSDRASSNNYAALRIDYNWDTVTDTLGNVIATSWSDLWDGTVSVPINRDVSGGLLSSVTAVNTGSTIQGVPVINEITNDCNSYSAPSGTQMSGQLGATSNGWISVGSGSCNGSTSGYRVYCFENTASVEDRTPDSFQYDPMTKQALASSVDVEASAKTITGISNATSVSISGGGSPEYKINSGPWTSAAGTLNNNDVLTIRADAPATENTRNKVVLTIGTYSVAWYVGAGNPANTKRIFVRSTGSNANLSGVGGADSLCSASANAASLGTGWSALISDSSEDGYAVNRTPLNWGTLTNMNGDVVAQSWDDLWDGSIQNLVNRTQTNTVLNDNVWTGTTPLGRNATSIYNNCTNWTSSSGGQLAAIGSSGATGTGFYQTGSNLNCSSGVGYLYCVER